MTTSLDSSPKDTASIRSEGATWGPCPPVPPHGSGPRVLVVFAGRHGSTREIAATLARWLPRSESGRRIGLSAVLAPAQRRPDPAPFDAVVVGSAVYGGRWLEPAGSYLEANAAALARRATWSFSSGVWRKGAAPLPDSGLIDTRGHRWFPGRLEHRLLSAAEREALSGSGAPAGDHRDWRAVREWADEMACELMATGVRRRHRDVA